jgi:hypothetical protein
LRIKFESFGGTRIDADSIVITYRKRPAIDLTQRLKPFIEPTGLVLNSAEVPRGEHRIRVDLKDTDGHSSSAEFTLRVSN